MNQRLVGWKEVARYIQRSVGCAKKYADKHKLPVVRVAGLVEADTQELDRWREEQAVRGKGRRG